MINAIVCRFTSTIAAELDCGESINKYKSKEIHYISTIIIRLTFIFHPWPFNYKLILRIRILKIYSCVYPIDTGDAVMIRDRYTETGIERQGELDLIEMVAVSDNDDGYEGC